MIKTIELGSGREITLANDIGWLMEYRDQFGQDIVPSLMPMLLGTIEAIGALAKEAGGFENIDQNAVIELMGSESLVDVALKLSAFEAVDILNITWALAKAYDPNIKEPKKWIRELSGPDHEEIPLFDVVVPAVAELVIRGVISSKNWERLKEATKDLKKDLQPKKGTKKK